MEDIQVLGSVSCEDTQRIIGQLESKGVPYEFVSVDTNKTAAALAADLNGGRLKTPTIVFSGGGPALIEPSNSELTAALTKRKLIPDPQVELM